MECIPIVAETLGGGLAEDAIFTVRSLGRAIADRAGSMDPISTTRHIFQRFAIALWRGCVPLAPSPSNPPTLSGWCRLTFPFHLCHASHAIVFIFVWLYGKTIIHIMRMRLLHVVTPYLSNAVVSAKSPR